MEEHLLVQLFILKDCCYYSKNKKSKTSAHMKKIGISYLPTVQTLKIYGSHS